MANDGIRTPNYPLGTDIGEFLGHEVVGTTRSLKRFSRDQVLGPFDVLLSAFQGGGGIIFGSVAGANANLQFPPFTMAWVVLDPVAENNGIYQKSGLSGAGFWGKLANLPYSFYRAVNSGTGTANAIVATNAYPIASTDSLIVFDILLANTSANVTVQLNDGTPLPIKTAAGHNPAVAGFQPGMVLAGYITPLSEFRLITDQASAAIQAAAEAAQAAAEAAEALAIQAANLAVTTNGGDVPYPSRALAAASTIAAARKYIIVEGYATPGDALPILYERVASQPAHKARFRSVDRFLPNGTTDATNGGWWAVDLDLPGLVLTPNHFGAANDNVSYDDQPIKDLAAVLQLGICKSFKFKGTFRHWETAAALSTLFTVTGVDGLTVEWEDASFTTNAGQLDLVLGSNWSGYAFHFIDCKNFRSIGRPKFIGDLTFVAMQTASSAWGTIGVNFEGNCSGLTFDGVEGDGILCPFYIIHDASTVMASTEKPIISVAGTGYTVGNTLTLVGGGGSTPVSCTVDAINGSGGIRGITLVSLGNYPSGTLPTIGSGNGFALTGGSGTGGRAYIYMQRAVETEHTVGGTAGHVRARKCFYGYVQRDSGDNITAYVDAEFCYRSTFVYGGIIGARIYTTMRHIYRTAVLFGSAFHGLGNQDCYFHIKMKQATASGSSIGDCICRPLFSMDCPTRVSAHVDIDLDYGTITDRAANFMEISKYNAGVADDLPRGHDLKLKLTGRIKGKSDLGAAASDGTHLTMTDYSWAGDYFGGWEIGPLEIEGGGDIVISPGAFPSVGLPTDPTFVNTKGGIYFDVVNPDGNVTFNNALNGTDFKDPSISRCAISVSPRSRFKNLSSNAGAGTVATIGCIADNGTLTLLNGWHDFSIMTNGGTGSTIIRDLSSDPFKGQKHKIENSGDSSGTVVRLVPPVADHFAGRAAGKYLDLALGASVEIKCFTTTAETGANGWAVTLSNGGTLTYQA